MLHTSMTVCVSRDCCNNMPAYDDSLKIMFVGIIIGICGVVWYIHACELFGLGLCYIFSGWVASNHNVRKNVMYVHVLFGLENTLGIRGVRFTGIANSYHLHHHYDIRVVGSFK